MAKPAARAKARRKIVTEADIARLEKTPYDELVPFASTWDILRLGAERFGDRAALIYSETGDPGDPVVETSYRDLYARVTQAANLFHSVGVGRGDAVGFLLPNIPEAHYALWGAGAAGRACPINFMLRTDYIIELLEAAGAKALVALGPDPELDIWPKVVEIAAALPQLELVAQVPGGLAPSSDAPFFTELMAGQDAAKPAFVPPTRDDIAALYHTGGTTGAPKLAQHRHGNQVHTAWSGATMYDIGPDDVMVNGFPLFHVAGSFVFGLSAFVAGSGLLLPTRTGMRNMTFVKNYWRFVEAQKVTMLACVPTVLAGLMNVPAGDADLSAVRIAWTGGSPLPNELAAAFEAQTGLPVRNLFGMTECAGIVSIAPAHGTRAVGGCGLRLPFTEIRAFANTPDGPDMSTPLPPDETGVVALRGPHVSPGYTDPARNAGTFTQDGWLISGDLGWVDEDGQIYLTGRAKDVIIRGAHNIDPAMIEEIVDQHPSVEMSAAIGQPDAYAGELPMVYVTLKPGQKADPDALTAFIAERIPEQPAMPKRVVIIDEMPVTQIGKIYKPTLRARAIEHVFAGVLAPLGEVSVRAVDAGGKLSTDVRVPAGKEDEARALLRDFAVESRIAAG